MLIHLYCAAVQPPPAEHFNSSLRRASRNHRETAELVTAAGRAGIPVRVDHTSDEEVAALFARVQRDEQRLDI